MRGFVPQKLPGLCFDGSDWLLLKVQISVRIKEQRNDKENISLNTFMTLLI